MTPRTALARVSIAGSLLVGTLAWLLGFALVMVPASGQTDVLDDLAPYGTPGPHAVGTRTLARNDHASSPELALWYPATPPASDEGDPGTTYAYELEMFGPLESLTVASYHGRARWTAPADPSAGPYPLVVLSPGYALGAGTYAWLAEHLASHGFVVIAPDHEEQLDPGRLWRSTITRPRDILAVLDHIDDLSSPGGDLAGLIDTRAVAVIGHSYGGYTALASAGARLHTAQLASSCERAETVEDPVAFQCDVLVPHLADMASLAGLATIPHELWPATADPRVDAAVALAGDAIMFGPDGLAQITVPIMTIGGTADNDSPFEWGTGLAYEHATSPRKLEVSLHDAEHFVFSGPCENTRVILRLVPTMFCSNPGLHRRHAHPAIAYFTTAFLLAELTHDPDAAAGLANPTPAVVGVSHRHHGYADHPTSEAIPPPPSNPTTTNHDLESPPHPSPRNRQKRHTSRDVVPFQLR